MQHAPNRAPSVAGREVIAECDLPCTKWIARLSRLEHGLDWRREGTDREMYPYIEDLVKIAPCSTGVLESVVGFTNLREMLFGLTKPADCSGSLILGPHTLVSAPHGRHFDEIAAAAPLQMGSTALAAQANLRSPPKPCTRAAASARRAGSNGPFDSPCLFPFSPGSLSALWTPS